MGLLQQIQVFQNGMMSILVLPQNSNNNVRNTEHMTCTVRKYCGIDI